MTRRMRDMARRRRDMARRRMRDGRNPYGSRGGYVVSDRARRYGMEYDSHYDYPEHSVRNGASMYSNDYAKGSSRSQSVGQYDGNYGDYNYDMMDYGYDYAGYGSRGDRARNRRDYRYRDYGENEEYLSDDELMEWSRELLKDVEEKDKGYMTRENITQRAKDMGVKFKDFTEDEFVVTSLMMYTDYCDTLGTGNLDVYLKLAKDWLEDDDVEVQGSEKLSVYYDEIVCGE